MIKVEIRDCEDNLLHSGSLEYENDRVSFSATRSMHMRATLRNEDATPESMVQISWSNQYGADCHSVLSLPSGLEVTFGRHALHLWHRVIVTLLRV